MKVKVYRDRCIGAGNCIGVAPTVFQLDFQGKARVEDGSGADEVTLRDAAEVCPTNAIFLYHEDGTQLYPPPKEA
jgi:ferredoxin